jgi:CBS domain-containing protein/gamma-glutamylcysteine synthetase
MGQSVQENSDPNQLRAFVRSLLTDLQALEAMIAAGMIERDTRRIGAEQELVLIDSNWRPAPRALEVLERLDDPHVTTELARFNLEINLDPIGFGGDCLSEMEAELDRLLGKVRQAARECGAEVVLTGILPTVRKSDLGRENLTPRPRYRMLDQALRKLRGGNGTIEFRIKGAEEVVVQDDSIMLEGCCTSFQVHFQVGYEEFSRMYNLAQLATAPVLAAAANSPLLFGRRLWRETRIPLFQQAVDTRQASFHLRERSPRVSFGSSWLDGSPLELFREDIARFRVLFAQVASENPFDALEQGRTPELNSLRVHNGTVWRWNRPCYGIVDGKAHLRIENRALPAGPSLIDEIANAAFFLGLVYGGAAEYGDIRSKLDFDDAHANFLAAASRGLNSQFTWLGGFKVSTQDLILKELLPLARLGLVGCGVSTSDIQRYLDIIEQRVECGLTGSQWLLSSLSAMRQEGTRDEAQSALTAATLKHQQENRPVHTWPLAGLDEAGAVSQGYVRVEEFMTTDLYTVHQDEPIELVAHLMLWKHIRHVPVENEDGQLVGLLSSFDVLAYLAARGQSATSPLPVSSLMGRNPLVIPPEMPTRDAMALLRRGGGDALLVVKNGRLVGIVTDRDFVRVAARHLEHCIAPPFPPLGGC